VGNAAVGCEIEPGQGLSSPLLGGPSDHNPLLTSACVSYAFPRDQQIGKYSGPPSRPDVFGTAKEKYMRSAQFFKGLFLVLALASLAFGANNTQKGNFEISAPVQVSGTQLPAGGYVARWQGSGDNVKVEISRNGKVLATVPARVVELGEKAANDAAIVANGADGSRDLNGLRFAGKQVQLEFGEQGKSPASVK
jgi:hypothetical protein